MFSGRQTDETNAGAFNYKSHNNEAFAYRGSSLNFLSEQNSISNTFGAAVGGDISLHTVNLTNSVVYNGHGSKVGMHLTGSSNINIRAYFGSLVSGMIQNRSNINITANNSIIGGKIPSNYTNTNLDNQFAFFSANGTVSGIKSDGAFYGPGTMIAKCKVTSSVSGTTITTSALSKYFVNTVTYTNSEYIITFSNALPNANYTANVTVQGTAAKYAYITSTTTNSIKVKLSTGLALGDGESMHVMVFAE
jgi:hypothetical protein